MKICSWSSTTASEPDLLLIELVVRYQNDALKRRKKLFRNSLLGKNSLGSEQAPGFHHTLVQFSSVTQSCPTLCDPMNRSTPGLPVHHQLPEFTQTHVHRVRDAIQPSHPQWPPSPPALSLSQNQGVFQWVSWLHQVAKVLELQHHSFQWIFRADFL